MGHTLSVAPGESLAWALFSPGSNQLVACGCGSYAVDCRTDLATRVVVRVAKQTKLAVAAGEVGGVWKRCGAKVQYVPATELDESTLSPDEKGHLARASYGYVRTKRQTLRTAVAIGLKAVGR